MNEHEKLRAFIVAVWGRPVPAASLAALIRKKQPEVTALVGDFATWQRTRVFDADLTARFGAESDSERKRRMRQSLLRQS